MANEQQESPNQDPVDIEEIEAIEARVAAVNHRLATLLQLLAEGKPLGGALVGRHGPWTEESAKEFATIANGHDTASGSLWQALRAGGFVIIELPEAIYGALTPDTQ